MGGPTREAMHREFFSDESDKYAHEGPRNDAKQKVNERRNLADRHFMRFIEHT